MTLRNRWDNTWSLLGGTGDSGKIYGEIIAKYSEPHRKYHTLQHLEECFERLNEAEGLEFERAEVELVIWFHDVIYDPRRADNEQRSAEWCHRMLCQSGLQTDMVKRVEQLIMSTRHIAEPQGADAEVLADVDLGILGAARARFNQYEQQIREEFCWVPQEEFNRGRRAVLEQFLSRPTIFHTVPFREKYESAARENVRFSLSHLA